MDTAEFETRLKADGYTEIETKTVAPRPANDAHGHSYAVRGLVLDGIFTVVRDGAATSYRAGDVFAVPADCVHSEEIGAEGARILVGRRY